MNKPKATASITLYDFSKQIANQEEPMDPILFNRKILEIAKDFISHKYSMLLCNDRRDFTIFNIIEEDEIKFVRELTTTLKNRGNILFMDRQENGSWEIWIRDDGENYAYYLFDYTQGIVEV